MKKVLFLQIKGKSKAGVWFVNKTIAEELIKNGYEVVILSIRDNPGDIVLEHDPRLILHTINKRDLWEISKRKDVTSIKSLIKYLKEHMKLFLDFSKTKKFIHRYKPDYIITSHYQALDAVPKKFYSRTINEQHSSMKDVKSNKSNYNKLMEYSKKIFCMLWLSKTTKEEADKLGFKNNHYIYNPIRFSTNKIANVKSNKKLVCITRIDEKQKRISLMLEIVKEVLANNPDWSFEIYGFGDFNSQSLKILNEEKNIKYMGSTNNPPKVLLNCSINLNTSVFEGFSLSILEASMCGIPTITFDFGESVFEEINDGINGYIIEEDNKKEYINKLIYLMKNPQKLEKMSFECKEFSKNFLPSQIVNDWIELFNMIDANEKFQTKDN